MKLFFLAPILAVLATGSPGLREDTNAARFAAELAAYIAVGCTGCTGVDHGAFSGGGATVVSNNFTIGNGSCKANTPGAQPPCVTDTGCALGGGFTITNTSGVVTMYGYKKVNGSCVPGHDSIPPGGEETETFENEVLQCGTSVAYHVYLQQAAAGECPPNGGAVAGFSFVCNACYLD